MPPGYPPTPGYSRNPTDIVGERLGAAFIDWLLFMVVFVILTAIFGETTTSSGNGSASFSTDDSSGLSVLFWLAWIVGTEVVWQGLTGKTPGKALLKLTTVDSNTGQPPGIGKALIRTVLKIVDWLPCVAIVGIAMIASRDDHRRVGDLGAGTSVIKDGDVGRPVILAPSAAPQAWAPPGQPDPYAQPAAPGWGAPAAGGVPIPPIGSPGAYPPPQQPLQQPLQQEPPQTPPTQTGMPAEPGEMTVPDTSDVGARVVQDPVAAPPPPVPADQTVIDSPVTNPEPTADPGQITTTEPHWDKERDTYVQWDPVLAAWMQWDAPSERWVPIR